MPLTLTPHDYQTLAVEDALAWFASAGPSARRLYASPTGTGKSVMMLALQAELGEGAWIVTPRLEIVAGMLGEAGLSRRRL
jgi:superfamily II DNA or RNA helicase